MPASEREAVGTHFHQRDEHILGPDRASLTQQLGDPRVERLLALDGSASGQPYLSGYLTLPSAWAPTAALILGARTVVGIHLDGWGHFSDDRDSLIQPFRTAGVEELVTVPRPGQTVTV